MARGNPPLGPPPPSSLRLMHARGAHAGSVTAAAATLPSRSFSMSHDTTTWWWCLAAGVNPTQHVAHTPDVATPTMLHLQLSSTRATPCRRRDAMARWPRTLLAPPLRPRKMSLDRTVATFFSRTKFLLPRPTQPTRRGLASCSLCIHLLRAAAASRSPQATSCSAPRKLPCLVAHECAKRGGGFGGREI